jgi:small GTP-binding protein
MGLSVGIVGLPNVGKSTLFNALASRRLAETDIRPFTTIEPHEVVVPVPDDNLQKLSELIKPEKTVPATVTFVDIAGLVKDAHKGEGLGNQFLGKIREVDAIVHVLRSFKDESVAHVHAKIDPIEDLEVVNIELELGNIKGKPTIYVINTNEGDEYDIFFF